MSMLVASYGLVLVGSYLVGFVLLVIVYWKILKLIQRMKKTFGIGIHVYLTSHVCTSILFIIVEQTGLHKTYGVTSNIIMQGQSQAKQRVFFFLTVFLISGFFSKRSLHFLLHCYLHSCIIIVDLFLSSAHVIYQSKQLQKPPIAKDSENPMPIAVFVLYLAQV